MKSIQSIRDTADKSRAKADSLRDMAERKRAQSNDYVPDEPARVQQLMNEAQQYENQASALEQEVAGLEVEATDLEAKIADINRRKTEVQTTMQAEIDRLDLEEKTLRGEIHPFI